MNALDDQLALLPRYLGAHIALSITALAAGAAATAVLTLLAMRARPTRGPMLAAASVVQTVPSLALLALMVPLLGRIGFLPAFLALAAYSVLPMLRNTLTGLLGVDANIIEAARGVGMTDAQILRRVRLPLAAPTIIAGLRTSAVWVVGIATLATPVGATSLGNFIFAGLQTQRAGVVLLGCLSAAALALLIDGLIRLLESAAARRSRPRMIIAIVGLAALLIAGLSPVTLARLRHTGRPRITIGAKSFTEQHILAELLAIRLRRAGFDTTILPSLGSTVLFDALANDRVEAAVDYTGTIWANYMHRDDVLSTRQTRNAVFTWLRENHAVTALGVLGFENTYALAVTDETANDLNLRSVSDLTARATSMSIGGDYEFFGRPEWARVRDMYALDFADHRAFDASLMYSAADTGAVDVIAAFSTDGRIAAYGLTVLDEPLDAFPPYEAVLLMSPDHRDDPRFTSALAPLIGAVSDALMRHANMMVDVEHHSVAHAARWLDEQIADRAPATIDP